MLNKKRVIFFGLIIFVIVFYSSPIRAGPYGYGDSMDLKYVIGDEKIIYGYGGGIKYETSLRPLDQNWSTWVPESRRRIIEESWENIYNSVNGFKPSKTTLSNELFFDPLILEKFTNQTEVYVTVMLRDESGMSYKNSQKTQLEKFSIYKTKAEYFSRSEDEVISTLDESEFRLDHKFKIINAFSGRITKQGLDKLMTNPNVISIETNKGVSLGLDESIPLVNATEAWSLGYSGEGVAVCVIDSGINYTHPALGGCFGNGCKVVDGYDYCASSNCGSEDGDPMDDDEFLGGHGTHVAGIVASEDSIYRGVAPNASLIAMKACVDGSFCGTQAIEKAVDWCVANSSIYNIKVITMSIYDHTEWSSDCNPSDKLAATAAINNAHDVGIFVDAISGNDGHTEGISWPGCVRGATSVGATTKQDNLWANTNRGPNLDLLAPGVSIRSTNYRWESQSDFVLQSGTSMAAPHVAGAVAILLEKDPSLMPDEIEQILQETGKQIQGSSWKRIDVANATRDICQVGTWQAGSCGGGSCNSLQREYTRTVDPPMCDISTMCEYDESCVGSTITVCASGCDYTTIQAGLNVATNGDLVKVTDGGTYSETINWSTSDNGVILNCQGATITTSSRMTIHEKEGEVVMNCIFNASNGVKMTGDGVGNEFLNNIFDIEEKGINSQGDSSGDTGRTYIENNIIINADEEGIIIHHTSGSSSGGNNKLFNNKIFNTNYAIWFEDSSFNNLSGNVIENNFRGIYLDASSAGDDREAYIENNNISNNDYGVYIQNQDKVNVNGNYFCSQNSIYDIFATGMYDFSGGSQNRCENTANWNDTNYVGCTYFCDTPASVILLDPLNGSQDADGNIDLACYASDNYQLKNITLYHDISGAWQANQTKEIGGISNITTFTFNNLEDGTNFNWNCLAYDNVSRGSFAINNWSLYINITPNNPPTTPNSLLCDEELCSDNRTFSNTIEINCTGSTDEEGNIITYFTEAFYKNDDLILINTFNNSIETENLTFTGNENIIRYLEISKNANVLNATLNLTGTSQNNSIFSEANAYYDFEDGSGTTLTDLAGINDGTLNNMEDSDWKDPKLGDFGLNFDGLDEYINILDSSALDLSEGSVSMWVNRTDNTDDMYLITKGNGNGPTQNYEMRYDVSTEGFVLGVGNGISQSAAVRAGIIGQGTYHHVIFTWNSTSLDIWLDGVHEGLQTHTVSIASNSEPFKIASERGDSFGNYWDGSLDEIGIWNRVLSSQEIVDLYNGGNGKHFSQSPTNPYLEIGSVDGFREWEYAGVFNHSNNRTEDFSSAVNLSLNGGSCNCTGCVLNDNLCLIPFLFHSDSVGIIEYNDLDISYTLDEQSWREIGNNSENSTFNWNISGLETQFNVDLRCRAIDIDGSNNYSNYYNPGTNITIIGPGLVISDLDVVYMNNLNRVFRFVITNIVNSELENIVWSLDTGESNISSEYNSTLQSNEDLFVYAFYNYTSSGNYTVIASTMSDEFSDTESLEIEVI